MWRIFHEGLIIIPFKWLWLLHTHFWLIYSQSNLQQPSKGYINPTIFTGGCLIQIHFSKDIWQEAFWSQKFTNFQQLSHVREAEFRTKPLKFLFTPGWTNLNMVYSTYYRVNYNHSCMMPHQNNLCQHCMFYYITTKNVMCCKTSGELKSDS